MKIHYKLGGTSKFFCFTPCPFLKNVKVGSTFCCKCDNNKEYNKEEKFVICNYGEVEHPPRRLK